MDKILIKDLRLFAYHGVNEEEKINGQNFDLDLTCYVDLTRACLTDCLDDTVSYAKIIKCVKRVFPAEKNDLIERAARRTADAVLAEFPAVQSITLRLRKPEAPIQADFSFVAVEITVSREAE